jgi:hypothetical protein
MKPNKGFKTEGKGHLNRRKVALNARHKKQALMRNIEIITNSPNIKGKTPNCLKPRGNWRAKENG